MTYNDDKDNPQMNRLSDQDIRADRHGWANFIASQTNPQFFNQNNYYISDVPNDNHFLDEDATLSSNVADAGQQSFCLDRIGSEVQNTPLFNKRYKVALPDNEEQVCHLQMSVPTRKSACFNCMESDHLISDCPYPRDYKKIRENKNAFVSAINSSNSQERYHDGTSDKRILKGGISAARRMGKYSHLQPGQYSQQLRDVLGISDQQLPPFIYKMREIGYPPGWLQECLVYRNLDSGSKEEYDFERLISYPGFNIRPSSPFIDESDIYGVPAYTEELFSKENFVKSLLDSGFVAYSGISETSNIVPMELDEESIDQSDRTKEVVDLNNLNRWTDPFLQRDNIGDTIEETEGTPLAMDANSIKSAVPSIDQFSDGINEHRFFENLPGATGNFKRIMTSVQKVKDN